MTIRAALGLLLALGLMAATCDAPTDAPATVDAAPTPASVEPATTVPVPEPTPDTTAAPTPRSNPDRDVLVALYHATDGANWKNSRDWLSQEPITTWYGVWTDAAGRVTALWLSDNQLRGELPPELGSLTELKQLRLKDNELSGTLPAEVGRLANLEELLLNGNELTGAIPAELGLLLNLEVLHLHVNQLSGAIPSELGNLSHLKELWLAGNALTGEIPPALGSLSSLEQLFLNRNQLTGAIPAELGQLASLATLVLSDNLLSGQIPPELGNLGNLWSLWLFANQLTGAIPAELGNLSKLASLALFENQLSGAIPAELGSLADLQALDLSKNLLEGTIPPELGRLSELRSLWLSDNRLSGEIPSELGGLADLRLLMLSGGNQFTGCIPSELEQHTFDGQPSDLSVLRLPICGKPPEPSASTVVVVKVVPVDSTPTATPDSTPTATATPTATPGPLVQTAESRTGLPTVGDTLLRDDGLEVSLVSVQRFEELAQVHGSAFRPKNGRFLVVTITFSNTNDSGNIDVSNANISLVEPDGNSIAVDSAGLDALFGMVTEARPLFLLEAVPGGQAITVAVVFDIDPGLIDLEIDIEGFLFEVPNP